MWPACLWIAWNRSTLRKPMWHQENKQKPPEQKVKPNTFLLLSLLRFTFLNNFFDQSWKQRQKKMTHPSHDSLQLCSCGRTPRQWFMRVCNWVLIKSVSGARVIVCFQGPPCVSSCVIGCYRCCECMSRVKERMDRLQCDCGLESGLWKYVGFKKCFYILKSRDLSHAYFDLKVSHRIVGSPLGMKIGHQLRRNTYKNLKKKYLRLICSVINIWVLAHVLLVCDYLAYNTVKYR